MSWTSELTAVVAVLVISSSVLWFTWTLLSASPWTLQLEAIATAAILCIAGLAGGLILLAFSALASTVDSRGGKA